MAGVGKKSCSRGFALTELIVVILLISIVLGIATLNFSEWQKKYNIEAQVKEMLVDLNSVRQMAIQTKQEHRVILNPTTVSFRRYSSEFDATGTPVFNKKLKYPIQKFSSGALSAFSDDVIRINDRGYTVSVGDNMTIAVGVGLGNPAINCLTINWARVNLGKINGSTCEFK